jgi:hypothetical protein
MHAFQIVLALNALWFGAAFVQFSVAQKTTLKILLPRAQLNNPIAPTLTASVAFLGGMNLPLGLFSVYLLIVSPSWFGNAEAQASLFALLAACHFSQFAFNLPVLMRGGRVGDAYWPVLRGPMLRIFVIDGALSLANAASAAQISAQLG